MAQNPFNLNLWFKDEEASVNDVLAKSKKLNPFTDIELKKLKELPSKETIEFDPAKFFIPGWKGESLVSKCSLEFNRLLDTIKDDCLRQFLSQASFTKSLNQAIYAEFLAYAEHKSMSFDGIDDFTTLWKHIRNENSPYHKELISFLDLYTYRISIIYFHKIRFITLLALKLNVILADRELLNPNSFLANIFKNGSSTELKGQTLQSNHYTWYRPSPNLIESLKELSHISKTISIAEIVKNVSQKTENFLNESRYYSHALSHKHFGLFLNSLLLNFPIWLNQIQNKTKPISDKDSMDTVCTKYTGDFLESLSLSHWLAQENNTYLKWDEILCPDFNGSNFVTGTYLKLCNELQFLSFAAQIADDQGFEPVNFLCSIMRNKYLKREAQTPQTQMLVDEQSVYYDRIVLNLVDLPKNNSHHYLVNQIEKEGRFLKAEGFLYVLSTQKLFVPSQKEKVETLLKDFNLETSLNFDQLSGRGEVAPYIYIFSRSNKKQSTGYSLKKRQMLSFRIIGELTTFQNFTTITDELGSFYLEHLTDTPPLFHKELEQNLRFEFYQDAIVEGRLINSTSKDSSKITHPSFFRNLTSTCVGLDNFFAIKPITAQSLEKNIQKDNRLGLSVKSSDYFQYLMIIDQRNPNLTRLELTSFETFAHKVNEYGTGLCHFFGLTPKIAHINLNLFRYYFESSLGVQIIDLTFRGSVSKFKSKLEGLFIPRFFVEATPLPIHLESCLGLLKESEENLLMLHPHDLKSKFNMLEPILAKMLTNYSYQTYGLSLYFLHNIQNILEQVSGHKIDELDFNHKALQEELRSLPTKVLYPHNEDIFIEFKANSEQDLELILTKTLRKTTTVKGQLVHSLELFHSGGVVMELFAEEYTIDFVRYLLTFAEGVAFHHILTGLSIPSSQELKDKIAKYQGLKNEYKSIQSRLLHLLHQNLIFSISGSK